MRSTGVVELQVYLNALLQRILRKGYVTFLLVRVPSNSTQQYSLAVPYFEVFKEKPLEICAPFSTRGTLPDGKRHIREQRFSVSFESARRKNYQDQALKSGP